MLSWCVAFLPDLRNNLFIVEREQPSSRESFDSMGRFQCVPKFCSQRRKDLLNDVPTPRTSVPICNYLLIVNLHCLKHPNIQRLEGMAGVGGKHTIAILFSLAAVTVLYVMWLLCPS